MSLPGATVPSNSGVLGRVPSPALLPVPSTATGAKAFSGQVGPVQAPGSGQQRGDHPGAVHTWTGHKKPLLSPPELCCWNMGRLQLPQCHHSITATMSQGTDPALHCWGLPRLGCSHVAPAMAAQDWQAGHIPAPGEGFSPVNHNTAPAL